MHYRATGRERVGRRSRGSRDDQSIGLEEGEVSSRLQYSVIERTPGAYDRFCKILPVDEGVYEREMRVAPSMQVHLVQRLAACSMLSKCQRQIPGRMTFWGCSRFSYRPDS